MSRSRIGVRLHGRVLKLIARQNSRESARTTADWQLIFFSWIDFSVIAYDFFFSPLLSLILVNFVIFTFWESSYSH